MTDKKWFEDAINQMAEACEERNRKLRWHQTISGKGPRATLSQQFSMDPRKFEIGWNSKMLLVGQNRGDAEVNKTFPIDPENPDKALSEALKYISILS